MIRLLSSFSRLRYTPADPRTRSRFFARSQLRGVNLHLPNRNVTLQKFNFPSASHTVLDLGDLDVGSLVAVHGHFVRKPKNFGARAFAQLRDVNGDLIQVHAAKDSMLDDLWRLFGSFGAEDCVLVSGTVSWKVGSLKEFELNVAELHVLNKGGQRAAHLEKLTSLDPASLDPAVRYLQLRTSFYQKALRARSKAVQLIRNTLIDKHDFVEIETPLLFKSTPEGAREFLVPTRTSSKFYALPQSPQQYKQILMSSGFQKYFQIAKCFRDEDLRSDRQPEFTQVDLEMSFVNDSRQIQSVIDDIVLPVWEKIAGKHMYKVNERGNLVLVDSLKKANVPAFNRLSYKDALLKYGIDKPDLRSALTFKDLSGFFEPVSRKDFPIVEACVLKNAAGEKLKVPKQISKSSLYPRRHPAIICIKSEKDTESWWQYFVDQNVLTLKPGFSPADLKTLLGLEVGDILAFSTRAETTYENPTPLGKFRQLAMEHYPGKWLRPIEAADGSLTVPENAQDIFVGSWVVNFPLFSPVDISPNTTDPFPTYSETQLESTHHPFTMVKPDDYDFLETNPLKARGEHYDLVINGVEVGGGSRRIHDPELQRFVFEQILNIHNHKQLFGHLIKALELGCPPHAGIALGFDRLCAMLVGSLSIKDVIAFPKNQSGADPVVESPSVVPDSTLQEYHISRTS